jgi:predicted SnoaL-like aldol condensation-catalyzing enzyme
MDVQQIVVRFNDCINAQDIDGLARLMSDDHAFIDSENNALHGKAACVEAWRGFFSQFPDYRNTFTRFIISTDRVTIVGYSTCSEPLLAGAALWTAKIGGGKVTEWRVSSDTPANRQRLGITDAN